MITIQVYGLDQFVVGRYSRENTPNIAQAFECPEDDITFYAPEAMMFHNGVEQTSWNTLVVVLAPSKYRAVEKTVAETLAKSLSLFSINVDVVFQYYEEAAHYSYRNEQYPRFITTDEIRDDAASMQFGDEPELMEGEEDLAEDGDPQVPHVEQVEEDIYLGDAFAGFEERIEENYKKKSN